VERVHQAGQHGLIQQLPHGGCVVREAEVGHQRLREREAAARSGGGGALADAARRLGRLEKRRVPALRGGLHRRHHPPLQLQLRDGGTGSHRPAWFWGALLWCAHCAGDLGWRKEEKLLLVDWVCLFEAKSFDHRSLMVNRS